MINPIKFSSILALVVLTSTAAISIPTIVFAQNMTGNMTGGQNTTADINQTGSISSIGCSQNEDGSLNCSDDYSDD